VADLPTKISTLMLLKCFDQSTDAIEDQKNKW